MIKGSYKGRNSQEAGPEDGSRRHSPKGSVTVVSEETHSALGQWMPHLLRLANFNGGLHQRYCCRLNLMKSGTGATEVVTRKHDALDYRFISV